MLSSLCACDATLVPFLRINDVRRDARSWQQSFTRDAMHRASRAVKQSRAIAQSATAAHESRDHADCGCKCAQPRVSRRFFVTPISDGCMILPCTSGAHEPAYPFQPLQPQIITSAYPTRRDSPPFSRAAFSRRERQTARPRFVHERTAGGGCSRRPRRRGHRARHFLGLFDGRACQRCGSPLPPPDSAH